MKHMTHKMLITITSMVLILSLTHAGNIIAASPLNSEISDKQQTLISQLAEMTGYTQTQLVGADIIDVTSNSSNSPNTRTYLSNASEKGLRIVTEETDGLIREDVLVPYKQLDSGQLVNSFSYMSTLSEEFQNPEIRVADMTVMTTAYYTKKLIMESAIYDYMYTPKSLYVQWYSSAPASEQYIAYFDSVFESVGDLYDISVSPVQLIQSREEVNFWVNRPVPTEGVSYGDWAESLPDSRGLRFNYALSAGHGSLLRTSFNYVVNGVSNHYAQSWDMFYHM